ncbi:MAG TPA: ribonuclease D [Coriobacteriia bacterium]|nr:ribonuclease D [Coriobacteriia bacterium]
MYITDTSELAALVAQVRTSPLVAIDTEFMRERTYFAKLCLIQIATDDVAAIVDPLAVGDLSPLCELLTDRSVVKVLHAGSQDLEIFFKECGAAMAPVFDTQVAATLAGFPQQVGYGALVHEMLGEKLDKGDTYTDWAKRPLAASQVEYALNDVRYLPELYRQLMKRLEKDGRVGWLERDFAKLEDPATYTVVPEEQWRRVKRISSLNRRQLAVAREVAAWREKEAMRRDVPKRWVIGDESIVEVSRRVPKTAEELMAIRGVGDKIGRSAASGVLAAVARGLEVPDEELPSIAKRRRPAGDVDAAVDLMVAIVRLRARERGVAMPLLASRDELERLAAGERDAHPLLAGWRAEMVGNELVELIEGRIDLRLDDGELVVTKRS